MSNTSKKEKNALGKPVKKFCIPYKLMLVLFGLFITAALLSNSPDEIVRGICNVSTSRSILITDYIEVGGIGAALFNAVFVGIFSLMLLYWSGTEPNGSTIMALWLSVGFAFFGKTIFNMLPITFGVWLFSRVKKIPFKDVSPLALLCTTMAPMVSEFSFAGNSLIQPNIIMGMVWGIAIGFILPPLSIYLIKIHSGYCLYNVGFTGGVVATFVLSIMKNTGIDVKSISIWSGNNNPWAPVLLYTIAVGLIGYGMFAEGGWRGKMQTLREIFTHTGRLSSDYFTIYGAGTYVNMGLLCILSTTLVLVFGADLTGPAIGGIFTLTGFGAFGKHLKNVTPVLIGAVVCIYCNGWDLGDPINILFILFSSCLAPIAGQFGPLWGILAGFLHVTVVNFIGMLAGGLNLYSNGFAGGFVVMFLVPIIMLFRKTANTNN